MRCKLACLQACRKEVHYTPATAICISASKQLAQEITTITSHTMQKKRHARTQEYAAKFMWLSVGIACIAACGVGSVGKWWSGREFGPRRWMIHRWIEHAYFSIPWLHPSLRNEQLPEKQLLLLLLAARQAVYTGYIYGQLPLLFGNCYSTSEKLSLLCSLDVL